VVLRGNKYQTWTSFRSPKLWLRGPAKGMQDADDYGVSGDDANTDRHYHGDAENERHEERNQGQTTLSILKFQTAATGDASQSRKRGSFNLPALTPAAIND
jgi:hypothetical protein